MSLSPICKKKKKRPEPGPNGLSVSGPDGLARALLCIVHNLELIIQYTLFLTKYPMFW